MSDNISNPIYGIPVGAAASGGSSAYAKEAIGPTLHITDVASATHPINLKINLTGALLFEETDFGYLRSTFAVKIPTSNPCTLRIVVADVSKWHQCVITPYGWEANSSPTDFTNETTHTLYADRHYNCHLYLSTMDDLTPQDIISVSIIDDVTGADYSPSGNYAGISVTVSDENGNHNTYPVSEDGTIPDVYSTHPTMHIENSHGLDMTCKYNADITKVVAITTDVASANRVKIWDGTVADKFAGGSGSSQDPYLISTGAELALMVDTFGAGKYYKLISDIYLNDVSRGIWTNEWFHAPVRDGTQYLYINRAGSLGTFTGCVDGAGCTVYGLYHSGTYNGVGINSTALIPTFGNGRIDNLIIDYAKLRAQDNVACFIGKTARDAYIGGNIVIDHCTVGQYVTLQLSVANGAAAGFVGYATIGNTMTIKNSCSLFETIEAINTEAYYFKHCGLIGQTYNTPYYLRNCYSVVQPFNTNNEAARRSTISIAYTNVYTSTERTPFSNEKDNFTKVSKANAIGAAALDNMPGLKEEFNATTGYPAVKTDTLRDPYGMLFDVNQPCGIDISVKTYTDGGEFYVEPNTMYTLSATGENFCTHDSPAGSSYSLKYLQLTVGQLENGVARAYVSGMNTKEILGQKLPDFSNWPLDAIQTSSGYKMKLTYPAGATVIIIRNKVAGV